jgi:hypothetical protein
MTVHISPYILSSIHPTTPTLKPPQHSINTETFERPPHEKDNTNTLVEKTQNSRGKRNQKSGTSGT